MKIRLRTGLSAVCSVFVASGCAEPTSRPGVGDSPGPMRPAADILPPFVCEGRFTDDAHPLAGRIRAFCDRPSEAMGSFHPTGLTRDDYLRVIDGMVGYFRKRQDASGVIIDPVANIEWQYSTPCYALSVALLSATGHRRDPDLLASGVRAMDAAVAQMHEYRPCQNHGDFFTEPVMLALELFEQLWEGPSGPDTGAGVAPSRRRSRRYGGVDATRRSLPHLGGRIATWRRKISEVDPYRLYHDHLRAKEVCFNHNVVALAGEWMREKRGLSLPTDYFERHMEHQTQFLNPVGMYRDQPPDSLPAAYDVFTRRFLASILAEGYRGKTFETYRDAMWRGAWTSLFMQSPSGEAPAGGRSSHHLWNEAVSASLFELYAAQDSQTDRLMTLGFDESLVMDEHAGAFKRAAHLSLASIRRWLKPDGTGFVVKNRYPPEEKHGYEYYSAQSQYNLITCWFLAMAYLYADDDISERPCPADVGGFVVPVVEDFHRVFANAGGTYVQYDVDGQKYFNPTGLLRIHLKGGNPQLGPSDGAVLRYDKRAKKELGGENLAVGPAWRDAAGAWRRLAAFDPPVRPKVEVLEERTERVSFRVVYDQGLPGGATRLTETVTVDPVGVTVEDVVEGEEVKGLRVEYPMLVFDGQERTRVQWSGSSVILTLRGGSSRFAVLEPAGALIKRTGVEIYHRNGQVESAFADLPGVHRAVFRISLP